MTEGKNESVTEEKEHILVGISSAPSNAKIVRTAAKMAQAFNGTFTALYVKTPEAETMSAEDRARLDDNIRTAERLGATIATVYGDDVSFQIAEYARLSGVTKIVVGRSAINRRRFIGKPTLTDQLIATVPNVDVHIIPDGAVRISEQKSAMFGKQKFTTILKELIISILILVCASGIGYLFSRLGFTDANIITIYILGVLITSAVTSSKICWVFSSVISVLVFNFLFTDPKFTFLAYDKGYPLTFAVMLSASLITGSLAAKMKSQAKQSSKAAFRTKVLFEANQLIQKTKDDKRILDIAAEQISKLLKRDVILISSDLTVSHYGFQSDKVRVFSDDVEKIGKWVIDNRENAGKGTNNFSDDPYLYLPVKTAERVYGVVAVYACERPIDTFEHSVTESIIGEYALALERNRNARERELASVSAENERLRANLLRAISHDLRTPLTSISGNATNLISNGNFFDEETKLAIYKDIYGDSMWLINLVENLLSVTRLEEGRMNVNFTTELIDDVIGEAIKHVHDMNGNRKITVESSGKLILAKMDVRLIIQVVINLLDNAMKYTPENSTVTVTTEKKDGYVLVSIADDGCGIPDEEKERVFDMFYSGENKIADSRRSLGLGLALCKSIIKAHGGEITVTDNVPHGAVFTFTLPAGEVEINE